MSLSVFWEPMYFSSAITNNVSGVETDFGTILGTFHFFIQLYIDWRGILNTFSLSMKKDKPLVIEDISRAACAWEVLNVLLIAIDLIIES